MTPTRASIIDGSVEVERGRALQAKFERKLTRNLKSGHSLSAASTFIPMARPAPIAAMPATTNDPRPEARSPAACTWCGTRGTYGCRHQQPYRERTDDA